MRRTYPQPVGLSEEDEAAYVEVEVKGHLMAYSQRCPMTENRKKFVVGIDGSGRPLHRKTHY